MYGIITVPTPPVAWPYNSGKFSNRSPPTDLCPQSASITRRSRGTHCPIRPAKRHSSPSDTAPEAPPQFFRIGQVALPTLSRNWVELTGTSETKIKPPPVSTTMMNPQRPVPPGFEPTTPPCSLDKGVACAQHIQLPTQTCARAWYECTLTSAHISKCMQTQQSLGNMKFSGSQPCWHKQ